MLLVLAYEILVCSKQQQGHSHCLFLPLSHDLVVASQICKYFLFGRTVTGKVEKECKKVTVSFLSCEGCVGLIS